MFASVRAAFNIPRDAELKLRDFPTLAHVIKFAEDRSAPANVKAQAARPPEAPARPTAEPAVSASLATPAASPVGAPRPIPASFEAADRIPRRVPVPFLRPAPTFCKQTGVQLTAGSRVIVMGDHGGVGTELAQHLTRLGAEVLSLDDSFQADALVNQLKQWTAQGPVHGIYWLPALDTEAQLQDMDPATWREAVRVRVKLLYATMRTLHEQIAKPGTFLVSATRLGGHHGYDASGAIAPLGGAVTGFTKAYKRERMDALVKAVDFEAERRPNEVADLLIQETLRDPGAVEIGYTGDQRWTVGLQEQPAADGQPALFLNETSVFLITGAAGSIVSAITADLAAASGGTFHLLDVVPEPDPTNPDLERFVSDKDGLKRDLFARIQARGERATPALVEKELAGLERAQAARNAIDAVRAAGGTAFYYSVNLTDPAAVRQVIDGVRERSGRIDAWLHGVGIERSHFLPDKDPREFDLVFDVKCDGLFNVLCALGSMPLGAVVAFSSIAGRFGNAGQTDYSAANDLLCKIASSFRTTRPGTRAIAIDWTAWGGIGMATRGSIPKMMEAAGIDMLPPEAGIPLIRRELTQGGTRGEIVVGQRLGVLANDLDPTGGLDVSSPAAQLKNQGPMLGEIVSLGSQGRITIQTWLDPTVQPFLHDHQIDHTPVLPGVMGIEAFAEAAHSVLPGWRIDGIEDMRFLAPFKFYRNEPRPLTLEIAVSPKDHRFVADCQLIGRRTLPNQTEPQTTIHFTGRVHLTQKPPVAATIPRLGALTVRSVEAADIYGLYFHGPAYQVIERGWWDGKRMVGLMARNLPVNHQPPELPTLMAPRLIELCFQTAGLWEMGVQGRMGLPREVRRVSLLREPNALDTRLYAVVTPHADLGIFDAEVVDTAGNIYLTVSGYSTVALAESIDSGRLKKLHDLMSLESVMVA
jgi:NAD(P)-dependent dehydrogenase (short-subunit alcohol dehydrogenase family)